MKVFKHVYYLQTLFNSKSAPNHTIKQISCNLFYSNEIGRYKMCVTQEKEKHAPKPNSVFPSLVTEEH